MLSKKTGLLLYLIIMSSGVVTTSTASSIRDDSAVNISRIQQFVETQVNFEPRVPGSNASKAFGNWFASFVASTKSWQLTIQNFTYKEVNVSNYIVTHKNLSSTVPAYLVGAHYDSRARATQGTNKSVAIPGANDGASGVAAIMELIYLLKDADVPQLGFILFDAEDQGLEGGGYGIENWEWIVGSTYYVNSLSSIESQQVTAFILLDLIGKDNLELKYELFSDDTLKEKVWNKAVNLGYADIFKKENGQFITDDHIPFLRRDIPAIDIIDLNYEQWHTVDDNLENINYSSIAIVTDVVFSFLVEELSIKSEVGSVSSNISSIDSETSESKGMFNLTTNLNSSISPVTNSPTMQNVVTTNLIVIIISVFMLIVSGRFAKRRKKS